MIYTIIQLSTLHRETAWWLRQQPGDSPAVPSRGSIEDAIENARGTPVILLVPTEEVLLTEVELKLRGAKLRKAIPYALEEQLAEEIEELHFVAGHQHEGRTEVAVVRRERMDAWLAMFAAHGISPRAIVPDVLALPWQEGEWFLATDKERALVRTGDQQGFACHPDYLAPMMNGVLENKPEQPPSVVHSWHCDGSPTLELPSPFSQVQNHRCDSHMLSLLAQGLQPRQSLNLLQGDYSQQTDLSRSLKPWRWAAALLGIWFVLGLVYLNLEKSQLSERKLALSQQAEAIYRNTFPDAKRVVNPRVQMEQKLKTLRGGASSQQNHFLDLLASAGELLSKEKALSLERVSYRGDQLTLKISAKSLGQLDAFKEALNSKPGIRAELRDADSSPDKATGQIRMQRTS